MGFSISAARTQLVIHDSLSWSNQICLMKALVPEQVEQCKAAIHTLLSRLPENEHTKVTVSSLIKAIGESSLPGIKDLTMSRITFRKHFGTIRAIKKQHNIKSRPEHWSIEHRQKIRGAFIEILSKLEPTEMLRVSFKDLRSKAIGQYPHLSIEPKKMPTLRQYFQITELKTQALSSRNTSAALAP